MHPFPEIEQRSKPAEHDTATDTSLYAMAIKLLLEIVYAQLSVATQIH
jgi:hypothetical protein